MVQSPHLARRTSGLRPDGLDPGWLKAPRWPERGSRSKCLSGACTCVK
ncbi:MAG TPA: hypothetical protein VFO83_00235 [Aggregicoccus sp.]|nr:hypothetical protein [Aggregicoccus sp.]